MKIRNKMKNTFVKSIITNAFLFDTCRDDENDDEK